VRSAWASARDYFSSSGHIPPEAAAELDHAKGHSYYLFDPEHLSACERDDGAFLAGDAVGLAQPITAEGILPAVVYGRLCGESIVSRQVGAYRRALAEHPLVRDYTAYFRARELGSTLRASAGTRVSKRPMPAPARRAARWATARAFAWMFRSAPLPRWVHAASEIARGAL
jgi:flavin-dependent dehydrogenase